YSEIAGSSSRSGKDFRIDLSRNLTSSLLLLESAMFSSPEELAEKLRSVQYVIANELLPVIYLAMKLGGPLLYSRGAARFRKNRVCLCRSESCWNGDRKAAVLRRDTHSCRNKGYWRCSAGFKQRLRRNHLPYPPNAGRQD